MARVVAALPSLAAVAFLGQKDGTVHTEGSFGETLGSYTMTSWTAPSMPNRHWTGVLVWTSAQYVRS